MMSCSTSLGGNMMASASFRQAQRVYLTLLEIPAEDGLRTNLKQRLLVDAIVKAANDEALLHRPRLF